MAFLNSLPIGQEVFLNWLLAVAGLNGSALGLTFAITSLQIGINAGFLTAANVTIAFNAAASCQASDVTLVVL